MPAAAKSDKKTSIEVPFDFFRVNESSDVVHTTMCAAASKSYDGSRWGPIEVTSRKSATCKQCKCAEREE